MMKTETQVVEKLEEAVKQLEELNAKLPTDGSEVGTDLAVQFASAAGAFFAIAWVLDCEEELAPVVNQMRIANIASKFKR